MQFIIYIFVKNKWKKKTLEIVQSYFLFKNKLIFLKSNVFFKDKLLRICKEFCKENFNIQLVFNLFKIKSYFSYKEPIYINLLVLAVVLGTCFNSYNSLSLKIIDKANSKFDLKIKKVLHINWRKPNLTHNKIT